MESDCFTPTQKKILDVLSDGLSHRREELWACLPDDMGPCDDAKVNGSKASCVQNHISRMRKCLRLMKHDIICELVSRRICYRHVRLLAPSSQE